ncbi:hypothetical protein A0H81_15008 [Grifola frondosa]|uniref:Uncharacterized protein n=1 Tax=Grifola frondosa TaxID=5627 RepID=A0A1C7LJK8_GRIFR|nr:hypothetical protein A0H81_15008 [Grifola frondosa]
MLGMENERKLAKTAEKMYSTFAEICTPTWATPDPPDAFAGSSQTLITDSESPGQYSPCSEGELETEIFEESEDHAEESGDEGSDVQSEMSNPESEYPDHYSTQGSFASPSQQTFMPPPLMDDAKCALADITMILSPRRCNGKGHKAFKGDELLRTRLSMMQMHLRAYIDSSRPLTWIAASLHTAASHGKSSHIAKQIRKWTRSFIADREDLPLNLYGAWNTSLLDKGELAKEIHAHLQGIGRYVKAQDIVVFLDIPEIKEKYALKHTISLATARRWMFMMDYRWCKGPSGQYVDGHEREDVVAYRQTTFLPSLAELEWNVHMWEDGLEEIATDAPRPRNCPTVIWWHDESTFYANDHRNVYWAHKDEKAIPRPKGEGASLMVVDFVSAEYGWLRFDGDAARILFKAGKAREGYFINDNILEHATGAMDILDKHLPHKRHVFIFDNATTHLKRAHDALSARHMSKKPTAPNKPSFGVLRNVVNMEGKPVYGPDGKVLKEKVPMSDAKFADGAPQPLYFPVGHEHAGIFKGMQVILEERGFTESRIFMGVPIPLSKRCTPLLLPQCWGYAKRKYRLNPPSSAEANLERNVIAALDSVPLITMRRFATRSHRFMDAYRKGLSGKQAIWASKKYRGHRVLPNTILDELLKAGI